MGRDRENSLDDGRRRATFLLFGMCNPRARRPTLSVFFLDFRSQLFNNAGPEVKCVCRMNPRSILSSIGLLLLTSFSTRLQGADFVLS